MVMQDNTQHGPISNLAYLDASKVTSPSGVLSQLDLLTAEGERLGSIEGVVIDAAARRVRYFDIRSSGWFRRRRYLVEADQLAQVESEGKALRLRVDVKKEAVQDLDAAALREFSDDDLLAALFPSCAA
jgi:PRC-barrel domain